MRKLIIIISAITSMYIMLEPIKEAEALILKICFIISILGIIANIPKKIRQENGLMLSIGLLLISVQVFINIELSLIQRIFTATGMLLVIIFTIRNYAPKED